MMEKVLIDKDDVFDYINFFIKNAYKCGYDVIDARYHHNATYEDAPLICKYGILTLKDLNDLKIKKYSDKILKVMDDNTSHANGNDSVSLSVVGLTDLYPYEIEYNSSNSKYVDFLVSGNIDARRYSINYGNEFIHEGSITNDKLRAIDIRILELLSNSEKYKDEKKVQDIITKYNFLKNIILEIRRCNLQIPLRERSNDSIYQLSFEKIMEQPVLVLKK